MKTNTAVFAQTPKTATAVTTGACGGIGTDTPTNTVLLMTAGADGGIVTRLTAMPRATVTASGLALFLSQDGGTTQRLIDSELMPAQSVSTTSGIAETTFGNYNESYPLRLGAGDRLYVGNQVALGAGVVWKAEYSDF
jgi:hypothetical protein